MGHLISAIAKYIQGLFNGSGDSKEKKQSSIMIQLLVISVFALPYACLLYTSDAADEG